jgi:two-component system cell cycle response regulator
MLPQERLDEASKELVTALEITEHIQKAESRRRFGHDAGDAVLREFSRRLQENIRGVDLVARFGGEEFFVAMPDVDQGAAAAAAERIRRAVEGAPVQLPGGKEVSVTVSIGVAIATSADMDAEAIIKRADSALYQSKESGRNRVSFFAQAA